MLKPEQPVQQQPMAPMPFYADPTRFTAPVWQAEPAQTWPQGQFIQQIPAPSQPGLETYPPQQYPNGIYQATYQQPGFETNTFYTGAVQVLTNTRPPSAPDHSQLTPRTNGSYSHTPSPVPSQQSQQQGTPRSNISGQYHQDYNQGYVAPSTPTGNVDNSSRPSSVNSVVNAPTNNPSFQQSQQQQQSGNNFSSVSANNFSPGSNQNSNYVNANSGNEKPGYPQVNSNPQLVSHSSSGYPGNQYGGANIQQSQTQQHQQQQQTEQQTQQWPVSSENMMWEPNIVGQNSLGKPATIEHNDAAQYNQSDHPGDPGEYSQSNRVELNSRIKSMILNKHQNIGERKHNDELQQQQQQQSQDNENKTGHFLWYSHHHRQTEFIGDGGGVPFQSPRNHVSPTLSSPTDKSRQEIYENANTKTLPQKNCNKHKDNGELLHCTSEGEDISRSQLNENSKKYDVGPNEKIMGNQKETTGLTAENTEDLKSKTTTTEIPFCSCFPPDKMPPEPGSYYTHLGCSNSLANLRRDYESRTGVSGKAIRIEKVRYAGKEGKSPQGCPLAKWILRRSSYDEKYLIIVKHREGHSCVSAYIVICMVAWDGVTKTEADSMYSTFTDKLNKFGLPTNRRCATNEQKTCACQGLDPKTCGASFSFGCSWSMYYNGCKYARSKIVRKFRLTERSEEQAVENRLQHLASFLAPLYKTLAPDSFKNQCLHEDEASDCRLGVKPGKPFSGVTACMDFCAHSHKDTHNMNDGCTMVVTLTKERRLTKHEEEQLHILPHYIMDSTDEFGSRESQDAKIKAGSIEVLNKYECEVRIRTVPLQPCRRRKKKDEDNQTSPKKENTSCHSSTPSSGYESSGSLTPQTPLKNIDASLLQSNHVSSTVLDSPISSRSWMAHGYLDYHAEHNANSWYPNSMLNGSNPDIIYYNASHHNSNNMKNSVLHKQKVMTDNTAFALTYPTHHYNNNNNINDSMRSRQTSQPAQINFTQNKVQDSHSGITRNTNQTVNNNNNNYNFGMNCHNNTSNVNMNKIGEPYKFHNNNICSYPCDPVSSMLSLNSSPMSAFKVPLTPPESPIRHSGLHNYAGGVNQFGTIDNPVHNNFFRPDGVNQFGVPQYINQFHTNLQYNNGFNPNFDLQHQFLPHNIALPASVQAPSKGLYHYNQNTYSHQPKIKQSLPPFHFFNNNQYINPNTYHLCNPFDDIGDYGLKRTDSNPQAFDLTGSGEIYNSPSWQHPKAWDFNSQTLPENTESLGKAIEVIDNAEAFMDSQVGGVAIALTHGSVMFECAKHELHCTTALKKPNRLAPTRISLVFYQHRNLNAAKHGWDQWEEKTRLRKLNCSDSNEENFDFDVLGEKMNLKALLEDNNGILMRAPALTTMSVATLLPMYPAS